MTQLIHQEKVIHLPVTEGNPGNNQQPASRNITISVVDSADNTQKVSNATITEDSTELGSTGALGGQATINGVTDGKHTITISASGYKTKTEEITVSSENTSFVIQLEAI